MSKLSSSSSVPGFEFGIIQNEVEGGAKKEACMRIDKIYDFLFLTIPVVRYSYNQTYPPSQ